MSSPAVASSSMTRTQSAVGERRPSEPIDLLASESALPGRRTAKTEPLPGSLATVTSPPNIVRAFDYGAILILLRQLQRRADGLIDLRSQFPRLRAELELAGRHLGEIKHPVDEAEKMSTRTVNLSISHIFGLLSGTSRDEN